MKSRSQCKAEELANSISHGLAFALVIGAAPFVIEPVMQRGSAAAAIGVAVFALTMALLYFSSALYHALPDSRAKNVCARLDHGTIFLFIAGSYTPFALGVLSGTPDWAMFGAIWCLAGTGVALKVLDRLSHPLWSTGLYVLTGWLTVAAAIPLFMHMPGKDLLWLLGGGLAYTAGAAFFLTDARLRFGHFIWHLFVMAGSGCHVVAVVRFTQYS